VSLIVDPPATAGGTDPIQVRPLTLSWGVEHPFLLERLFTFEFHACAFEECLDHFANAFLHFGANRALAHQNREPMQILRVFPAQLNVLDDLD
jgi:hypothetical protein